MGILGIVGKQPKTTNLHCYELEQLDYLSFVVAVYSQCSLFTLAKLPSSEDGLAKTETAVDSFSRAIPQRLLLSNITLAPPANVIFM